MRSSSVCDPAPTALYEYILFYELEGLGRLLVV